MSTNAQRKRKIEIELELRNRAAQGAEGSAPPPEPQEDDAEKLDASSLMKRYLPNLHGAVSGFMQERIKSRTGSPAEKKKAGGDMAALGKIGLAAVTDVGTGVGRSFGALTGQSEMGDPEGGMTKPLRDQMRDTFKRELAQNLESNLPYLLKYAKDRGLRVADVVSNFAVSLTDDLGLGTLAGSKTIQNLQRLVPGTKAGLRQLGGLTDAEAAIERAAAKGGAGLEELKAGAVSKGKGGADAMAAQIEHELESMALAKQKDLDDAFTGLTDTHPIRAFHGGVDDVESLKKGRPTFYSKEPGVSNIYVNKGQEGGRVSPVKLPEPDVVVDASTSPEVFGTNFDFKKAYPNAKVIQIDNIPDELAGGGYGPQTQLVVLDPEVVKPLYGSKTTGRTQADVRGGQLRGSVDEAQAAKMKKFGAEEERTLGSIGDQPIPGYEATALEPARTKAANLQKEILGEINYKPGEDVTGYIGGRVFKKDDTDLLVRLTDDLTEVADVNELLAKRRGVDALISYDKDFESRDFLLKGLRNKMNNLIEESFYTNIKEPGKAKLFADAWRANNQFYAEMSEALGGISKKLTKSEDYAKTLENMGIEKLANIFEMSKKHKELAPVAEQISAGYLDDFLLRATDTDGRIDFAKAKKVWSNLKESDKLMNLVVTKEQQSQIKFALDKFENTEIPGKWIGRSQKSISDKLGKLSNDDKRYAAKEVEFLDALAGRTGTDAMGYKAMAMSQADQLDIDKAGRLPIVGSHMLSRMVGSFGSQIRSPWGVVHATKALNMLGDIPKDKLDAIFKGGAYTAVAGAIAQNPEVNKLLKGKEINTEPGKPVMGDTKKNYNLPGSAPGSAPGPSPTPKPGPDGFASAPGGRRIVTPVAGGYEETPIIEEGQPVPRGDQTVRVYNDVSPSITDRLSDEQRALLIKKLKPMAQEERQAFLKKLEDALNKEAGAN